MCIMKIIVLHGSVWYISILTSARLHLLLKHLPGASWFRRFHILKQLLLLLQNSSGRAATPSKRAFDRCFPTVSIWTNNVLHSPESLILPVHFSHPQTQHEINSNVTRLHLLAAKGPNAISLLSPTAKPWTEIKMYLVSKISSDTGVQDSSGEVDNDREPFLSRSLVKIHARGVTATSSYSVMAIQRPTWTEWMASI